MIIHRAPRGSNNHKVCNAATYVSYAELQCYKNTYSGFNIFKVFAYSYKDAGAAVSRYSSKKMFLKFSQNEQANIRAGVIVNLIVN